MSAEKAAKAHTDLNTFGTIVSILEGGHVYLAESNEAADKIISRCKLEMQRCLRVYDREVKELPR